ncbi:MAG TPA: glycogen-binding domain-containing protein [Gemmatimonadales bacterium]
MQHRTLITVLAVAGGVLLTVRPAAAQRWQVDLSGNRVGYDSTAGIASLSVAPLVEWNRGIAYATLSGALAGFEGGGWTTQGHADLSLLFRPARSLSLLRSELVGAAGGSVHSGGYRTASTRGEFRLHLAGRSAGMWAGGTVAAAGTSAGSEATSAAGPTAGVWGRRGRVGATAVWTPFRLQGAWYQQAEGRVSAVVGRGRVELTGHAGWRGAPGASGLSSTGWGGANMTVWFAPQAALVVGGGGYAADLLQALPQGRYLSAGLRFSRSRPSAWAGTSGAHALHVHARGEAELRFTVPGAASRVDFVSDWTGWQPVPLQRAPDGRWVLRTTLPPGVHRFNLVVDGERWIVPEGFGWVDDGFGGRTSLMVVP